MTGPQPASHPPASPAPPTPVHRPPRERRQRVRWSWGGCDTIAEDPREVPPPSEATPPRPRPKPRGRRRACRSWEGYRALDEDERSDVMKGRWVDSMPGLKALVQRRSSAAPGPSATPTRPLLAADRQMSTPSMPTLREAGGSRLSLQSETSYSLSVPLLRPPPLSEPLRPVNRLRSSAGSLTRVCSRCSSLLSLASSSRYSLDAAGGGFEPVPPVLCKLCLGEVPVKETSSIAHCGCTFCRDCMKCYVQFEIQEGAYDISCPDAQCARQGVVSLAEVQILVGDSFMEKYKRYRLNREVDMDVSRLWCPKAGCETIVNICPTGERCLPQNVHCPTCASDFCSNCKHPWHGGITCEENTRLTQQLTKEPGIPFDNDLIKCCPMCNVPIEKDEGCAQMMCKRCKHVFCWYCLASLDDDFLLRHYDKGPCKNKLGHSRASVIWHRTQVIGIFAGFGILLLVASPLLLLAAPCIVCCKCRVCSGGGGKLDSEEEST